MADQGPLCLDSSCTRIFMTVYVLNFDMWTIFQNVTYVIWMVPLMNFGSIKGEKILRKLSNCQLLRNDCELNKLALLVELVICK